MNRKSFFAALLGAPAAIKAALTRTPVQPETRIVSRSCYWRLARPGEQSTLTTAVFRDITPDEFVRMGEADFARSKQILDAKEALAVGLKPHPLLADILKSRCK